MFSGEGREALGNRCDHAISLSPRENLLLTKHQYRRKEGKVESKFRIETTCLKWCFVFLIMDLVPENNDGKMKNVEPVDEKNPVAKVEAHVKGRKDTEEEKVKSRNFHFVL